MAPNTLSFLLPIVLVLGTVVGEYEDIAEVLANGFIQQETSRKDVPGVCPAWEYWDECGASCQKNCSNINDNPGMCIEDCVPGCKCGIGLVRGPNGICIKPKECSAQSPDMGLKEHIELEVDNSNAGSIPISIICSRNQVWSLCPSTCPDNCTNYQDKNRKCVTFCIPGCVCKSGYIKGPNGTCIKPEECPREKKPEDCTQFEYYDTCGTSCEDNCDNYKRIDRECDQLCKIGCFCLPGYVRGRNGTCIWPFDCATQAPTTEDQPPNRVLEEQTELEVKNSEDNANTEQDLMPLPIICRRNEVWSLCPSTCPDNCTNYQDKNRNCAIFCIPGCVCKSGYVVGPNGICIKPDQCPREKRPEDCTDLEYYDTCGSACEDNCMNYNLPDKTCDKRCKVGCFCLPGYVRGPKGDCILPFDCQVSEAEAKLADRLGEPTDLEIPMVQNDDENFCPQFEEFVPCQGICELDCKTKNGTLPDCKGYCGSSCRCKPGYVRGPMGTCIRPDECPEKDTAKYPVKRVCPDNEVWSGLAHCQKNCTHPNAIPCPRIIVRGCVCEENYIRSPNGKCVPRNKCPPNTSTTVAEPKAEAVTFVGESGCPKRSLCLGFCRRRGYINGMCMGPKKDKCMCVYDPLRS